MLWGFYHDKANFGKVTLEATLWSWELLWAEQVDPGVSEAREQLCESRGSLFTVDHGAQGRLSWPKSLGFSTSLWGLKMLINK